MKWKDYYEGFWDWAESTQITRISTLTDFTSSAEVAEIANEFYDQKIASRLVKRAMQNGIRFTPAEIIELAGCVTEEVLYDAIRSRHGQFNAEEYEELEGFCFDEDLLESVAKAGGIKRDIDELPYEPEIVIAQPVTQPVRRGPGFFATLLGLASGASNSRAHPGRCTGDCSNCPAHYGYRYGRWYYGHHHSHGCEFGGNDCSGRP